MKKGNLFFCWKHCLLLFAVMLFAGSAAAQPPSYQLELDQYFTPASIGWGTAEYHYTPSQDGTITIYFKSPFTITRNESVLWKNGSVMTVKSCNGTPITDGYSNVTEAVWDVQSGVDYSIFGYDAILPELMAVFNASSDSGGDTPGGEPETMGELPLNQNWTPEDGVHFPFTPPTDGVLTVKVVGGAAAENISFAFNNFLIYNESDESPVEAASNNGEWYSSGSISGWNRITEATWNLKANSQYYFNNTSMNGQIFYITFEASSAETPAGIIADVDPADGASFESFSGRTVKVKFQNVAEPQMVRLYAYRNITAEEITATNQWFYTELQPDGDGYWSYSYESGMNNRDLEEGWTIIGQFRLYSMANNPTSQYESANVTWYGAAESPESSTTFLGAVPDMSEILPIAEDGSVSFTANFSGPVTVNSITYGEGQGATSPITTYQVVGNSVQVTAPNRAVDTMLQNFEKIQLAMFVDGEDGKPVYTTVTVTDIYGENPETVRRAFVQIEYVTDALIQNGLGFDVYTLDGSALEGATVEAPFSSLKVSSTESNQPMNPGNVASITISDSEGNVVARGIDDQNADPTYDPATGILPFSDEITEPGTYTVYFPLGAFVFGDGMTAETSAEKTVTFTVEASTPAGIIADVDPADGASFESFSGRTVKVKFQNVAEPQMVRLYAYRNITAEEITATNQWFYTELQPDGDGYWSYSYPSDLEGRDLEDGWTIIGQFRLYSMANNPTSQYESANVTWYGAAESPESSTTFLGAVPDMSEILPIAEDGSVSFTANFSGPVTVNSITYGEGQGATSTITTYEVVGNSVNVTAPKRAVDTMLQNFEKIQLAMFVDGEDGKPVYTTVTVTDIYGENPETVRRAFVQIEYITDAVIQNGLGFDVYTLDGSALEGATVEAPFSSLKVSSTESNQPMNPGNVASITISDSEGNVIARGVDDQNADPTYDPATGILPFSAEITEPGTYTVYFPLGAFVFGDGMTAETSAEKTVTFTVEGEVVPPTYMDQGVVIYPESVYTSWLSTIEVYWEDQELYLVSESDEEVWGSPTSAIPVTFEISGIDGTFEADAILWDTWMETTPAPGSDEPDFLIVPVLMINLESALEDYWDIPVGTYTIQLPAGVVKNAEGALNPAQTFVYHVMESTWYGDETVTPPSLDDDWNPIEYTASELANIEIYWYDHAPLAYIGEGNPAFYQENTYSYDTERHNMTFGEQIKFNDDATALLVDLSSLPAGDWMMVIPDAYVIVDGEYINLSIEEYYTIVDSNTDGVSSLVAPEDGFYTVYNTSGVLILRTEDKTAVDALAPGLYIINGRKVLIRK